MFYCCLQKKIHTDADALLPGGGDFVSKSQILYYDTPEHSAGRGYASYHSACVEVRKIERKMQEYTPDEAASFTYRVLERGY